MSECGNVVEGLCECRRLAIELRKKLGVVSKPSAPEGPRILPLNKSAVVGLVGELRDELKFVLDRLEL
jgi:hypothetical protein